jgi:predicted nucleotidyltransferase
MNTIENSNPKKPPSQISTLLTNFQEKITDIYQDELKQLILFGSQARGEATDDSDIDILVVLKTLHKDKERHQKIIEVISDLCIDYGKLISCIYLSEERYQSEKSPLLINIEREGIVL